jgi:hypothetical protein
MFGKWPKPRGHETFAYKLSDKLVPLSTIPGHKRNPIVRPGRHWLIAQCITAAAEI